jgi:hypothetical protein
MACKHLMEVEVVGRHMSAGELGSGNRDAAYALAAVPHIVCSMLCCARTAAVTYSSCAQQLCYKLVHSCCMGTTWPVGWEARASLQGQAFNCVTDAVAAQFNCESCIAAVRL